MDNHKFFARNLKKWGRKIILVDSSGMIVQRDKCFMQALRYKNKMYVEGTPTEIGVNDSGYYLLIGSPGLNIGAIANGGYISYGNSKYHVDRWEKIYAGEDVFYTWAVLKEYTQGDYPCYDHFRRRGE